jgi:hypothetical protein
MKVTLRAVTAVVLAWLTLPVPAGAQQPGKLSRIGFLANVRSPATDAL